MIDYQINGVSFPGIQSKWITNRVVGATDGIVLFSPVLTHTWKMDVLAMPLWNTLQSLEGKIVSIISNHIYFGNTQVIHPSAIFMSLKGTHRGHLMRNITVEFSVSLGPIPLWYEANGIPASSIVAAYQALGADDIADSFTNLFNPGVNDLTSATPPTWTANGGWLFNGSNQFLDTGYILQQGDSVFVRYAWDHGIDSGYTFGSWQSAFPNFSAQVDFDVAVPNEYRIALFKGTSLNLDGFAAIEDMTLAIVRRDDGQDYGYTNGDDGTLIGTAGSSTNQEFSLYIGALHTNTGAFLPYDRTIQALAIYKEPLTDDQIKAVLLAMAAL